MNLVERFFRHVTQDVIREGSFTSVRELSEAIISYLAGDPFTLDQIGQPEGYGALPRKSWTVNVSVVSW